MNSEFYESILEVPEFEEMMWRRMRTLLDGPMADGEIEAIGHVHGDGEFRRRLRPTMSLWGTGGYQRRPVDQ